MAWSFLQHNLYGRIDILVDSSNPSGVFKPFEQMNWDEFIPGVNNELRGAFMLTKVVLPTMRSSHYGRIIYIESELAKAPSLDYRKQLVTFCVLHT